MKNELTFGSLVQTIELVHGQMTTRAKRAVNISLTFRNWLIGFYIDEYELQGADRADYGDNLFDALAEALEPLDVSSSGKRQLYGYLAFYRAYPQIVRTLSAQLQPDVPDRERLKKKVRTVSAQSLDALNDEVVSRLSYSHFEVLVRLDTEKRVFYERECVRAGWSVRELRRQVSSLYYERTALSTDKASLAEQAKEGSEHDPACFPIRDPYVFEFLGLRPSEVMGESDLEDALLDKLQSFLLELGHGFCFEARQKRILMGDTHNFVDLVFYHRVLKCHVLVELKVDRFTHEHIGQLNTYVSWYAENEMTEGDSPPIGLLLCTEKDSTVAKYALAGMSNQLFVSRYQVALPSPEEIQEALKSDE